MLVCFSLFICSRYTSIISTIVYYRLQSNYLQWIFFNVEIKLIYDVCYSAYSTEAHKNVIWGILIILLICILCCQIVRHFFRVQTTCSENIATRFLCFSIVNLCKCSLPAYKKMDYISFFYFIYSALYALAFS